jgi:hypothetical protein
MDNYREADVMEQYLGAKRQDELSALPDSMMDTTLFVGNLCEFVSDQDLSELFTSASHFLNFVPACVLRKPDLTSLQYGFVTFPSIDEKEVGTCIYVLECAGLSCSVVKMYERAIGLFDRLLRAEFFACEQWIVFGFIAESSRSFPSSSYLLQPKQTQ